MITKFKSSFLISITLGIIAYFALIAYFGTFTRFIADDYCSAFDGQRLGMFRYIWYWFITWGGRYPAIAADMLLVWLGQRFIGFVPAFALLLWILTNQVGFTILLPADYSKQNKLLFATLLSLLFVYSIFQLIPSIPKTFFWYSAFRTHTLAVIIFNYYLVVYAYYCKHETLSPAWWVFAFALSLLNGGFSESFTAIQILTFCLLIGIELFFLKKPLKHRSTIFLLSSLSGAILAMAILFLSPGTQNRQNFFAVPQTISQIVGISLTGFFSFYKVILKDPYRVIGLIASLLIAFLYGERFVTSIKLKPWQAILIALAGIALVFASYLPAAYGMGDILPRRAFPIPIFFGFVPLFVLSAYYGAYLQPKIKVKNVLLGLATIFLVGSLLGNSINFYAAREPLIQYAVTIDALEISIDQAKADGLLSLEIPKLNNWAGVFDPSDNSRFYVTACFSKYYGIQLIGPPIIIE